MPRWQTINAIPLTPLILTYCSRAGGGVEGDLPHVLAELGITASEASLFHVVHYGMTMPPADLPRYAAAEGYRFVGSVTAEGCRAALAACLEKGWLQVIDESALAKIADDLRRGRFLGPIYGFPALGSVDFTRAGAELWLRLSARFSRDFPNAWSAYFTPFAYTDVVHEKTARYCRNLAAAIAEVERAADEDDVVSVSGPSATGPWRAQWWRRFPEGHRIDVDQRRQWQGRSCGSGEECYFRRPPQNADPRRLRDILDRHNVSAAECLLLAAMEHNWFRDSAANLCRAAAESSAGQVGIAVSEEECRDGLEACLRYGWLRVLDEHAIDEVRALLRSDSAFLAILRTAEIRPQGCCYEVDLTQPGKKVPMPRSAESRWGEIDFSPAGATLYRMISAEWLGPNWEDDLHVSNTYYWEKHHYCESEAGFEYIAQKHVAEGAVVRASRSYRSAPGASIGGSGSPAGTDWSLSSATPEPRTLLTPRRRGRFMLT